jgi:hypothetical protein
MLRISWVAAELAASQEGLSSMSEWVKSEWILYTNVDQMSFPIWIYISFTLCLTTLSVAHIIYRLIMEWLVNKELERVLKEAVVA